MRRQMGHTSSLSCDLSRIRTECDSRLLSFINIEYGYADCCTVLSSL